MSQFVIANLVNTTLAAAAGSTATQFSIANASGLPTLGSNQKIPMTMTPASGAGSVYEIVYVTSIDGATLTVERGQEGTSALNWDVGDLIWSSMTAGSMSTVPATHNPTASETLPAGNGSTINVQPGTLTGDITLAVPTSGLVIGQKWRVYGSASDYSVTVASSVTSGSPYFNMPGGGHIYSWTIPAGASWAWIDLEWDGKNFKCSTQYTNRLNILDFGADPTGTNDSAPAIMAAYNYIVNNGLKDIILYLPAGVYLINSPVSISETAIRFVGDGCSYGPDTSEGTWIKITSSSFTPFSFTLGSGYETRGSGFWDIGFWQEQPAVVSGSSWTPTDYPYVINCDNLLGEFFVRDCFAAGITNFITSTNSGRLDIDGLHGQFYTNCFYIDNALDVCRIRNIHSWPYSSSASEILTYTQQNLNLGILGRVDTPFLDNIFSLATYSLLKFIQTSNGFATKVNVGRLSGDYTAYGLYVESPNLTIQISQLDVDSILVGGSSSYSVVPSGAAIYDVGGNSYYQIGTLDAQNYAGSPIVLDTSGVSIVMIGNGFFNEININNNGSGIFGGNSNNGGYISTYQIINSNGAGVSSSGAGFLGSSALPLNAVDNTANSLYAATAQSGYSPQLIAIGSDENIGINLFCKGNGVVSTPNSVSAQFFSAQENNSVNGPTAGYFGWSQPMQGYFKIFMAVFEGYENDTTTNQTFSFQTPFASGYPYILVNTTGLTISASSTTLTINAPNNTSGYSGLLIIIGS